MTVQKRRRVLRFSLGAMLLGITAIAIAMGIWANAGQRQRLAVNAVKRIGGSVRYNYTEVPANPRMVGGALRVMGGAPATPPSRYQMFLQWSADLVRRRLGPDYVDDVISITFNRLPVGEPDPAAPSGPLPIGPTLTDTEWKLLFALPDVRSVTVQFAEDADLAKLWQIPGLRSIDLQSPLVTAAGMQGIGGAPDLTSLRIYADAVSLGNRGINEIGQASGLTDLRIEIDEQIDVAHVSAFEPLQQLRRLAFGYRITLMDADVARLEKLSNLVALEAASFDVTDEGVASLSKLTRLVELDLSFNEKITDEGLRPICGMENLEVLELAGTKISGDCLEFLGDMPKLKRLNLVSSTVELDAVEALRRRRPDLEVVHWGKSD